MMAKTFEAALASTLTQLRQFFAGRHSHQDGIFDEDKAELSQLEAEILRGEERLREE